MSDDKPRKEKLSPAQSAILRRQRLDRLREQEGITRPLIRDQCKNARDLLRGLRKHRVVATYPLLVRACNGDMYCAAMLSQLLYWLEERKDGASVRGGVVIDGERYIANTYPAWGFQLGLHWRRVKTIVENLMKLRFIKKRRKKFHGQPMLHLTVRYADLGDGVEIAGIEEHRVRQLDDPNYDVDSL